MQARSGGIQAGRQLPAVLLRSQQLLAQRDVFLPQRVAQLGHLADLGFKSIEFGVHGATIGGGVRPVNRLRIKSAHPVPTRLLLPARPIPITPEPADDTGDYRKSYRAATPNVLPSAG